MIKLFWFIIYNWSNLHYCNNACLVVVYFHCYAMLLLQIKRPYFHVKPLEKAQLKNWKEYLEFEIENGTHERVVVLFERCVISCALYEEFWIKVRKLYGLKLEYIINIDLVTNLFCTSVECCSYNYICCIRRWSACNQIWLLHMPTSLPLRPSLQKLV